MGSVLGFGVISSLFAYFSFWLLILPFIDDPMFRSLFPSPTVAIGLVGTLILTVLCGMLGLVACIFIHSGSAGPSTELSQRSRIS